MILQFPFLFAVYMLKFEPLLRRFILASWLQTFKFYLYGLSWSTLLSYQHQTTLCLPLERYIGSSVAFYVWKISVSGFRLHIHGLHLFSSLLIFLIGPKLESENLIHVFSLLSMFCFPFLGHRFFNYYLCENVSYQVCVFL